MRTLLLIGLMNMISLQVMASSPVDLICSWENGNGTFLSMNIPVNGDIARLDKNMLSEYKVELVDVPYNDNSFYIAANTGRVTLPSFSVNSPLRQQYTQDNMQVDSNNEMSFGYYDLAAGAYTLAYGPAKLKIAVPYSVAMDINQNKIQNVGRAVAVFSNGDKFFATCDLEYNHE